MKQTNLTPKTKVTKNISVDFDGIIVHVYYKGQVFARITELVDEASLTVFEQELKYTQIEGMKIKGKRIRRNSVFAEYTAKMEIIKPTNLIKK